MLGELSSLCVVLPTLDVLLSYVLESWPSCALNIFSLVHPVVVKLMLCGIARWSIMQCWLSYH